MSPDEARAPEPSQSATVAVQAAPALAAAPAPAPPGTPKGAPGYPDEDDDEGFRRLSSRTVEVRLLVTGFILLGAVVVELAIASSIWPGAGKALWQGVGFEMFTGREAGIPVALQGGAPPWIVAQVSATQDIGVVCLAFPLVLWALHKYRDRDNFVMRRLRRIQERARKHKKFVRRWGPLGIFVFMLVPFLVNGPLLGATMGRVAGISTKYLIAPVVGATVLAALMWAYAYELLFALVGDLDPRIPPALTIAIVGSLLLWAVVGEVRESRQQARQAK